jgi:hypothetical protein
MKSPVIVLLICLSGFALLLSGCVTPAEGPAETEMETVTVEKKPAAEPEKIVRVIDLLEEERSFFADGTLDEYTVAAYEEDGERILAKETFSDNGELLEKRNFFYEDGFPVKEEVVNGTGELQTYYVYEYDNSGNLLTESTYDPEGELQLKSVYDYDNDGRKTEWSIYSGSGALFSSTKYVYEQGNFTKAETYTPAGDLDVYFENEYDSDGNMMQSTQHEADGSVLEFRTYEYAGGALVEEVIHRQNGSVKRSIQYTNNERGNPVEIIYKNASGTIQERLTRKYVKREYIEYLEE